MTIIDLLYKTGCVLDSKKLQKQLYEFVWLKIEINIHVRTLRITLKLLTMINMDIRLSFNQPRRWIKIDSIILWSTLKEQTIVSTLNCLFVYLYLSYCCCHSCVLCPFYPCEVYYRCHLEIVLQVHHIFMIPSLWWYHLVSPSFNLLCYYAMAWVSPVNQCRYDWQICHVGLVVESCQNPMSRP